MVMKAEPFFRAVETLTAARGPAPRDAVVLLSPRGRRFDQRDGRALSPARSRSCCCADATRGSTSGCARPWAPRKLSLGDFVLTGGEVAALAVIEAAVRLLPGALGDEGSAEADSFADGVLDFPHYTRPVGRARPPRCPTCCLGGDHGRRSRRWRRKEALRATRERRPDLLARAPLSAEDERLLRELENEERRT